jgi:hypothetical protein
MLYYILPSWINFIYHHQTQKMHILLFIENTVCTFLDYDKWNLFNLEVCNITWSVLFNHNLDNIKIQVNDG